MAPRIALTFDTEESSGRWPSRREAGWRRILDVLEEADVKATFFVIGSWARAQPDLLRRTAKAGHLIGNHTQNHVALGDHPEMAAAQIIGADETIRSICGMTTKPWFRLPYLSGEDNADLIAQISELGFEHIKQNCDPRDWNHCQARTARAVANRVLEESRGKDPVVVLLHSWPPTTPKAVRRIIAARRREGAEFVTIDQLTAAERAALPSA